MKHSEHDAGQSGEGEESDKMRDAVEHNIIWLQAYDRLNDVPIGLGRALIGLLCEPFQPISREHRIEQMRDQTLQALVQSGDPRVIIPLFEFFAEHDGRSPNITDRIPRIIEQLAAFGESALLPALEAFDAKNAGVRKHAVKLLGQLGNDRGFSSVVQALKDEDPWVRHSAILALAHFERHQTLPLVMETLQNNRGLERSAAVYVLGCPIFREEEKAMAALMDLCKDPDGHVRACAIYALGRHRETRAIPYFLEAMRDDDSSVRFCAVRALGEVQATQAIPLLIPALADREVQVEAGRSLLKFGDKDAVATGLLVDHNLSVSTKLDTLEAFIKIDFHMIFHQDIRLDYRSPSVEHYCQELLQKEIPSLAKEAIQGVLEEIKSRRDRQVLLRASDAASRSEELLRATETGTNLSPPEEMLRASDKTEEISPQRRSWLSRFLRLRH